MCGQVVLGHQCSHLCPSGLAIVHHICVRHDQEVRFVPTMFGHDYDSLSLSLPARYIDTSLIRFLLVAMLHCVDIFTCLVLLSMVYGLIKEILWSILVVAGVWVFNALGLLILAIFRCELETQKVYCS